MEPTRKPVVAGIFYAENADKLREQVESCFLTKEGKELPLKKGNKKIFGLIVPHAGYQYSGQAAAYGYKTLAATEKPDTIIILGPAHTGLGTIASIWHGGAFETPLGAVEIDRELGEKLKSELFDVDPEPHLQEHCIEVQLPFLQTIYQNNTPKILPIVFSAPLEADLCRRLGRQIAEAIKQSGKDVLIITSSDFTHYGASYGFVPFFGTPLDIKKKLGVLDFKAIEQIEKLDVEGFVTYVKESGATICGAVPIAVHMAAARELGAKKAKLLKYYTSADTTDDWSNSVSYAAIVLE